MGIKVGDIVYYTRVNTLTNQEESRFAVITSISPGYTPECNRIYGRWEPTLVQALISKGPVLYNFEKGLTVLQCQEDILWD
jgi:hypothetical protein